MAVPVKVQPGFDLEVLSGEALVETVAAADALGLAPGFPAGLPDCGLGSVRHADGPAEVIGVDMQQDRCGVDVSDDGQRQIRRSVVIGRARDVQPKIRLATKKATMHH